MAFGQSSFRRILLSRLLLLSVPVLLTGVYVTYRKARSAFLETARKNLTESAILKGESISQSIEALKTNLANASDAEVLKSDSLKERLSFVTQLKEVLPTNILCTQLTDLVTNNIVITTCGEKADLTVTSWHSKRQDIVKSLEQIDIQFSLPTRDLSDGDNINQRQLSEDQLILWLNAPVYDRGGNLRYALSVKSSILSQQRVKPGSFGGYSVVIDQEGMILAHPSIQKVGLNISQMPDQQRLSSLLRNAIEGKPNFLHLFFLEKDGVELVAGYASIDSPITHSESLKWVILAVTPLNDALFPLKDIRRVLVIMTIGLIIASSCANLYISQELARPLEKIRDYALKKDHLQIGDRLKENFAISEFNQLSLAINEMVTRLRSWGDEITAAWKEAKNANQLKSEFLATTSHELRTPLNGIINCIRVVKDGYCDSKEEEMDFLNQADEAAIHLLDIINDVLDISKIEAGKLSVLLEKVDLGELINEVLDLQLVPIQHKGLTCKTFNLQNKIYVQADRAKLKQVLINVIGNAVKFTESGCISIQLKIDSSPNQSTNNLDILSDYETYLSNNNNQNHSQEDLGKEYIYTEDNRKVFLNNSTTKLTENINNYNNSEIALKKSESQNAIITIKDTGIGIDPSQQEKLFRPFVMVDGSTTRKFGGTGLGLAISRNLMELMDGEISLHSEGLGKGTTLTIVMPLSENVDK